MTCPGCALLTAATKLSSVGIAAGAGPAPAGPPVMGRNAWSLAGRTGCRGPAGTIGAGQGVRAFHRPQVEFEAGLRI
jgi:hypothetical protein